MSDQPATTSATLHGTKRPSHLASLASAASMRLEMLPFLFAPAAGRFVIVTGADSTHYSSLCQFFSSALVHEANTKIVAFDQGLTATEREELHQKFPAVELRAFDFAMYPSYFNIKVLAGEYAWKPVIVADILEEFKGAVCWMDAGNVITKPLTSIRKIVQAIGLYSPTSGGTVADWTHPGTLAFLHAPREILTARNLCGYCVAVNSEHEAAAATIRRWKECALTKECIAPEGSSRANHRQDQAVLTVLAHMAGLTGKMPRHRHGFRAQQDVDHAIAKPR